LRQPVYPFIIDEHSVIDFSKATMAESLKC